MNEGNGGINDSADSPSNSPVGFSPIDTGKSCNDSDSGNGESSDLPHRLWNWQQWQQKW